MSAAVESLELERLPQVLARVGVSAVTLWRMRRRGEFPNPVNITPGSVAWVKSEVDAWIRARIEARNQQQ